MFSFDLSNGEKLIKVYRQSESLLIKPTLIAMAALYIPIWFSYQYFLLQKLSWLLVIWTFIVLIYAVNKYMLWMVTTYLITNQRAVAVTYSSLARRQTDELAIERIALIRQKSSGLFSHLFKFGTVELEGGGAGALKFENIPNPKEVKEAILKAKENK